MTKYPAHSPSDGADDDADCFSAATVDEVTNDRHRHQSRHETSAVKHLTCFWWKEKGGCRFSDDDCLYAHRDTGHYTEPPRQVFPGEPAMAGRKLERAMRTLTIGTCLPPGSPHSFPGSRSSTRPSSPFVIGNQANVSRNFSSPLASHPTVRTIDDNIEIMRLTSDNEFLRTLVDQNGKEKAILISTIENLQSEKKASNAELDGLRTAQEQLLGERAGLLNRIKQFEDDHARQVGGIGSRSNPFGTIGRNRGNTEVRYLGGLLRDE